jgi:uncharacterized coiled-coil DUF342 family protein
LSKD